MFLSNSVFSFEIFSFFSEFFLVFFIVFLLFYSIFLSETFLYSKVNSTLFGIKISIFFLFILFFILLNFYGFFESFSAGFLFEQTNFIFLLKIFLVLSAIFCFLMGLSYFRLEQIEFYEFSILFLLSFLGIFCLLSSTDFLSFYLSIELQSLSFYILSSFKKNSSLSTEAGLTYFILGAISSGFFLLGFSFIFGFLGLTNFNDIAIFGILKDMSIKSFFADVLENFYISLVFSSFFQDEINFFRNRNLILFYREMFFFFLESFSFCINVNKIVLSFQKIEDNSYFLLLIMLFLDSLFDSMLFFDIFTKEMNTILLEPELIDFIRLYYSLHIMFGLDLFGEDYLYGNSFDDMSLACCFNVGEFEEESLAVNFFDDYVFDKFCYTGFSSLDNSFLVDSFLVDSFFKNAITTNNVFFGIEEVLYFFISLFDIKLFLEEPFVNKENILTVLNFFVVLGILFFLIAIFFKLGLFPFHFWIPNVYEGVPTIITAIFSIIPKIGIFGVFLKLYFDFFIRFLVPNVDFSLEISSFFLEYFLIISIFSIVFGSLGALYQTKIKRLYAYSAISHVGFMGVALSLNSFNGFFSFFFYLIIYVLLNINFFLIYINLRRFNDVSKIKKILDLQNLTKCNVILSFCFMLNLFSMGGIPPLSGFFSKFFIFFSLLDESFFFASAIIIGFSILGCFYYLRVVKILYYSKEKNTLVLVQNSKIDGFFIILSSGLNLSLVIYPQFYMNFSFLLTETLVLSHFS